MYKASFVRARLLLSLVTVTLLSSACRNGDSQSAYIRLLNVSTGYSSLDLYTQDTTQSDSSAVQRSQAVGYETLGNYVQLGASTYTVSVRKNGLSATLSSLTGQKLTDDSHNTYIGYGSSGHFGVLIISEDQSQPNSGQTLLTVLNASEAGALDVYLTDSSTSLNDASPSFSVSGGSGSSATSVNSGTYRLRITGSGDKTDLRLDVAQVTFSSQQIASLILTSTSGGVLVNAMILPQQGTLTKYENTRARIRGAVGVANGTVVSASIGGTALLSGASVGAISPTYALIDAGTLGVTLSVNGTPVTVADQTLAAGGDYTLLAWSDSNGTETTLLKDDNAVANGSTTAKVRVVNGMSGLAAPISFQVDFAPAGSDVAVGQASSPIEYSGGTDYEFDVYDAAAGTQLFTKTSVSLAAGSVYTLFMTGGGTTQTINGTIRKDR
jgi:hypothetical protein